MNLGDSKHIEIPVLPIRDIVVYPHMIVPLFIGREKSIRCLESAMKIDKKIILVTQKEASNDDPNINDLFLFGTISFILQMLKLPDGTVKILVEGLKRVKLHKLSDNGNHFIAEAKYFSIPTTDKTKQNVLVRSLINQFEQYIKLNKRIPKEILTSINKISDVEQIIDTISAHIPLKLNDKQSILEIAEVNKRLEHLIFIVESEISFLKIENKIKDQVRKQMEKSQKEYYLNEKIKSIQKELSEIDSTYNENETLKNKILTTKMPKEVKKKIEIELKKLKTMPVMSAESTVVRNYIDWILSVPWKKKSRIKKNLIQAEKNLDKDHYGLESVKDRILEYLAVQNRSKKSRGPILCFVGPPGVGKTSLGKSIAKVTGRKYIRMSLGGLRDEAEIRGHRRTYIGSMPGKIIQKISKSGVRNPVFLLDEIDKISLDTRGDPASALLEVLDPEQNMNFNDHYLEVDYNLSDVMFIATANSINIPDPLLDRMEVIHISSYIESEKFNIAKKYLFIKQLKINALKKEELVIEDNALINIIRYYTKESGVRNLEREISKICRKTVKILVTNKDIKCIIVKNKNLKKFLGIKKFNYNPIENKYRIGQVNGLAWTGYGGDLLTIEATCIPGKGNLIYTGSLGKIMQESIQIALTVVKSRTDKLKINSSFYKKKDIHVHVPEGAIKKDGPSAGIAVCVAIISYITKNPIKKSLAMTGEITLQGKILPIGGLKEKLLAANRSNIKTVLIPYGNRRNLEDEKIPKEIIKNLHIYFMKNIDDVLAFVLKKPPYSE